jgi:hypothetical protein
LWSAVRARVAASFINFFNEDQTLKKVTLFDGCSLYGEPHLPKKLLMQVIHWLN